MSIITILPVGSFVEVFAGNFETEQFRKLVSELVHIPVWVQIRNFALGFVDMIAQVLVDTPVWELSCILVSQRVDKIVEGHFGKPDEELVSTPDVESARTENVQVKIIYHMQI